VVSWSAMRRSGAGVPSSGRPTPISCAVGAPAPATHGTSTRSSSKINGKIHYLWRAVDQHGNVLDILVQPRRDAKAAKKFFRRLLKGLRYVPRVLVTDKLASYGAAHRVVMPSVAHRRSKYLNNRAENSHQPTQQRERAMKRFKSARHAQRFLSAFSGISPHFRVRRHLLSAADYRQVMTDRFAVWGEVTALDAAA
jgi:putative transposase